MRGRRRTRTRIRRTRTRIRTRREMVEREEWLFVWRLVFELLTAAFTLSKATPFQGQPHLKREREEIEIEKWLE